MNIANLIHRATRLPGLRGLRPFLSNVQARRLHRLVQRYHAVNPDPEVREVLDYLARHPELRLPLDARPPYDFADRIHAGQIEVRRDARTGFPVTVVNGNPIYFPADMPDEVVRESVAIALREQHEGSPHEYLNASHDIQSGDTAVLVGASDGIFCLSLIERVRRAILFEPDARWHAPLRETTRPWADKVEVVPKFLGSVNDDRTVSLDALPGGREAQYIQADVEGHEAHVIRGAAGTIRGAPRIRMSICCYHNHGDAEELTGMLRDLGLQTRYSHGYFVMGLRAPYLRRAVIYAWKG
jgi:hypothetical protein